MKYKTVRNLFHSPSQKEFEEDPIQRYEHPYFLTDFARAFYFAFCLLSNKDHRTFGLSKNIRHQLNTIRKMITKSV